MSARSFVILMTAAFIAAPLGRALEVPFLAGRVNDLAEIVPADAERELEDRLRALEQQTGVQMAVLTLPSLEGENLEDFSMRVAETWKLGQKDVDNGVLFLVARQDRKMRLEVGYGLEDRLTDAISARILDGIVRPYFRDGDFAGGVRAAVDAVAGVLEGQPLPAETAYRDAAPFSTGGLMARLLVGVIFLIVVGSFSLVAVVGKGGEAWFLYLFLIPFWTLFPMGIIHPVAGLLTLPGWVIGFPVLRYLLRKTRRGKAFLKRHPGLEGLGPTRGGSGRAWSSSSGSFSGGGGSFGGGGASSSW